MKRIRICVLVGVLSCSLVDATAWAQATTAQISGTVKDQSGAVLPGVEITATQTATGAKRTAVSNETGNYVLASLPLGPYMVEAALPGFKSYVQSGIVLQVDASPTINVVLQLGQVTFLLWWISRNDSTLGSDAKYGVRSHTCHASGRLHDICGPHVPG